MTDSSAVKVLVSATEGVEKRRGTRLMVDVPITVMGMDTLGEPFKESATTISVSCYGCKYRSRRYAPKESIVTLEIRHAQLPKLSRIVHARVVWVQRPRHHRETFQIGIELEKPGNVWGIDSPPADWFPHPEDFPQPAVNEAAESASKAPLPESASPSATPGTSMSALAPANEWETLEVPHSVKSPGVSHAALDPSTRDLVKESVRAASDAIIAEEIALLKKHFTGRLESALLETLKTFSELSVEIVNETREACRASARQMEEELQRIAREAVPQSDPSRQASQRKMPQSKRRKKDSEH